MNVKKYKSREYIHAIVINAGLMILFSLLFEMTFKSDDYDMMNVLYGGYNGEYSPFLLYSNVLYGHLLCALLRIAPTLPWYTITQCAFMLWGMIEVTNVFLKKARIPIVVLTGLLSFIYYECFIRITFSKTAGLLIICGFLILFHEIDSTDWRLFGIIKGFVMIFLGHLIRGQLVLMIMVIYFGGFVVFIFKRINGETERDSRQRAITWKRNREVLIRALLFAMSAFLILFGTRLFSNMNATVFNTDSRWSDFIKNNDTRAALFDYGIPEYNLYREEYEKLGVSYDDYHAWFDVQLRDDQELLSFDMMKKIRGITKNEGKTDNYERLNMAFHGLIRWCFNNTMFYLFICCGILVMLTNRRERSGYIIPIILAACLFVYFYLYFRGRTQHHVDAVIFITGSFLALYYCEFRHSNSIKLLVVISTCLIAMIFVNSFSGELGSSSYYGDSNGRIPSQKEEYARNKADLDLLVDDREHLYLFNVRNTVYSAFTAWEIIPQGYYHNLHRMNMDHIPIHKNVLADFGVRNPFREIVDSNTIFYYISYTYNGKGDAEIFKNYICENYNEDAIMEAVKTTEQGIVYRVYTDKLVVDDTELLDASSLVYEFDHVYDEENKKISIQGYAYEEGTDSFAQNIYIKLTNKYTKAVRYYPTVQRKNTKLDGADKYSGAYSNFSKTIELEKGSIKRYAISIILENEHGTYSIDVA